MKTFKANLVVFCLSVASVSIFAATPSKPAPSYALTHSTQTFVLTSNTPLYDKWKLWIDQQNVERHQLGPVRGPGLPYEVGLITITVTSGQMGTNRLPGPPSSPPDHGPPTPLPLNGSDGQTITITNQTTTIYQQWVYEWEGRGGAVGGAWKQVAYRGYACRRNVESGSLCDP